MDGLAEEVRQGELAVMPGPRIGEVLLDQRAQAEAFGQLAREQESSVRGHRGAMKLDAKLGIEREAKRTRCCATHWMMPSPPARTRRGPHFLRI